MPPILQEIITKSTSYLGAAGIKSPRLEAELMIGKVLCLDRIQLYVQFNRPLEESELAMIRSLLTARAKEKVPIAYLIGSKDFYGHNFIIPPKVFIPRPETEELVDIIIRKIQNSAFCTYEKLSVLDLCAGSGVIGLSVAKKFEGAEITAVDISADACAVIRENSRRLCLRQDRVMVHQGDLWQAISEQMFFDIIIANPPYIATNELHELPDDIIKHEPLEALDGGHDGLNYYHRIMQDANKHLYHGGIVAFEHGYSQRESICDLTRRLGFAKIEVFNDLHGMPRFIMSSRT